MSSTRKRWALGIGCFFAVLVNIGIVEAQETDVRWAKYTIALRESLIEQGSARALTLASMVHSDSVSTSDKAALLQRARAQDPDSPLINWLIALNDKDDARAAEARETLSRVEPTNGALLLVALESLDADNGAGMDSTLAHFALAKYYDDHLGDVIGAWLDQFEAHPELAFEPPLEAKHEMDGSAAPLVQAIAYGASVAMPGYQILLRACSKESIALAPQRSESCIGIGNLVANHSSSLISRVIGISILEKADPMLAAQPQRLFRYLATEGNELFEHSLSAPSEVAQLLIDWRQTRSEIAVLQRLLQRAGKPLSPPASWSEPPARFLSAAGSPAGSG